MSGKEKEKPVLFRLYYCPAPISGIVGLTCDFNIEVTSTEWPKIKKTQKKGTRIAKLVSNRSETGNYNPPRKRNLGKVVTDPGIRNNQYKKNIILKILIVGEQKREERELIAESDSTA